MKIQHIILFGSIGTLIFTTITLAIYFYFLRKFPKLKETKCLIRYYDSAEVMGMMWSFAFVFPLGLLFDLLLLLAIPIGFLELKKNKRKYDDASLREYYKLSTREHEIRRSL